MRRLCRLNLPVTREIDVGDLEEISIGLPVRLVVLPGGKQAGDQALAQSRFPFSTGVINAQGATAGPA